MMPFLVILLFLRIRQTAEQKLINLQGTGCIQTLLNVQKILKIEADPGTKLCITTNHVIILKSQSSVLVSSDVFELGDGQYRISVKQNLHVEPVLICSNPVLQTVLKPLSLSQVVKTSIYGSSFFAFAPHRATHLTISNVEGYLSIIASICSIGDITTCLENIKGKKLEMLQEIRQNSIAMLNYVGLKGSENLEVSQCNECVWVILLHCIIPECFVELKFDQHILDNKQKYRSDSGLLNESKQVEFKLNKFVQVVIQAGTHPTNFTLSCQSIGLHKASNLDPGSSSVVILYPNSPLTTCTLDSIASRVYLVSPPLQRLSLNQPLPLLVTHSAPIVLHAWTSASTYQLQVNKCTSSPIVVSYYTLPDYDKIKARVFGVGESAPEIEDYITRRSSRWIGQGGSIGVEVQAGEFMTSELIIEVEADSYSYVQLALYEASHAEQHFSSKVQTINIIEQSYQSVEEDTIKFALVADIGQSHLSDKEINQGLDIVEADRIDELQLRIRCPKISFYEPNATNQIMRLNQYVVEPDPNNGIVAIRGQSARPFIGIYIDLPSGARFIVVNLKAKASHISRLYPLLLLPVIGCLLVLIGAYRLISTKPQLNKIKKQ